MKDDGFDLLKDMHKFFSRSPQRLRAACHQMITDADALAASSLLASVPKYTRLFESSCARYFETKMQCPSLPLRLRLAVYCALMSRKVLKSVGIESTFLWPDCGLFQTSHKCVRYPAKHNPVASDFGAHECLIPFMAEHFRKLLSAAAG